MADQKSLKLLRKGVEAWNIWRDNNFLINIDLSGADLSRANLNGANLLEANLLEANLEGANLEGAHLDVANLVGANLVEANLVEALLVEAHLEGADLKGANLVEAFLDNANLSRAQLLKANLEGAHLDGANLVEANLEGADLVEAFLVNADLSKANLSRADLSRANLRGSSLSRANLSGANLEGAMMLNTSLVKSIFLKAKISGTWLYGTARDDWEIEGVICDYVFWDENGKIRSPKDRDFNPGEFEALYKQLPTFEYIFENGFRPIDAILMSRIVDEINNKNPEFELKLDSFHPRGQPHAKFTVLHKEHVEEASKQVTQGYSIELKALKGRMEDLEETVKKLSARPNSIHYIQKALMGDNLKIIEGNSYENKDGQMAIGNDINQTNHGSQTNITRDITNGSSPEEFIGYLNYLLQELTKQKTSDEIKSEIENELKGAQIQAKKPNNKDKVAEKLKGAIDVLKNAGLLAVESAAFGGMIGKAIEWCGHIFTGL